MGGIELLNLECELSSKVPRNLLVKDAWEVADMKCEHSFLVVVTYCALSDDAALWNLVSLLPPA